MNYLRIAAIVGIILVAIIGWQEFRVTGYKVTNKLLGNKIENLEKDLVICDMNVSTLKGSLNTQSNAVRVLKERSNEIEADKKAAEQQISIIRETADSQIEEIRENASGSCEESSQRFKKWVNSLR